MNEDEVFERVAGSLAGMQTTQVMSVALNIMGSAIRNLAEGNHELVDELYAVTCESLRRVLDTPLAD